VSYIQSVFEKDLEAGKLCSALFCSPLWRRIKYYCK